jgi:ABC-type transport system involved in multi-copper enzyme maturation permease subunit
LNHRLTDRRRLAGESRASDDRMKTYVIALTTFKEIVRRPIFWLIYFVAAMLTIAYVFIPYYTLGEDIKMLKDQGLTTMLVAGLIVALFSASVSIADEIEGKTALTLLSKPISRRSFIVGKYLGIMAAILLLFLLLSLVFLPSLAFKEGYDARESARETPTVNARLLQAYSVVPGIVLSFFEVGILTAVSVALSTRFPLHLNVTAIIGVFALGHLAPMMVDAAENQGAFKAVGFMAKIFATILPSLQYFNIGPAISTDVTVPWFDYVGWCFIYAVAYSMIALFLALLMFEDRDLA